MVYTGVRTLPYGKNVGGVHILQAYTLAKAAPCPYQKTGFTGDRGYTCD
jgi:hypothetical protein